MQQRSRHDGGVSEAVGFLLIFTMVIVGIGLVTLYGYPMLIQQQTSADKKIMEKNMIVLQNDIKSPVYKAVPYKETSLKIGGGTLAIYNSTSLPAIASIDIYDAGTTYVSNFRHGDIRYESVSARTDISLQDGAVVMRRFDEMGSVMLAKPRWFYDSVVNTFVISLVSINTTEFLARDGIGTVRMTLGETTYNEYAIPAGTAVYLKYTPDSTGSQDYSVAPQASHGPVHIFRSPAALERPERFHHAGTDAGNNGPMESTLPVCKFLGPDLPKERLVMVI